MDTFSIKTFQAALQQATGSEDPLLRQARDAGPSFTANNLPYGQKRFFEDRDIDQRGNCARFEQRIWPKPDGQ